MKKAFEEAAQWCARLEAPDCSFEDRMEFKRWIEASEANRTLFEAAEQLSRDLALDQRLICLANEAFVEARFEQELPEIQPPEVESSIPATQQSSSHQGYSGQGVRLQDKRASITWGGALAAGILLAFVWLMTTEPKQFEIEQQFAERYDTERTAEKIYLQDGSVAELDANTEVRVQISEKLRLIELTKGRALFDVAHDPDRPFVVLAGSSRVTALGTRFQVENELGAFVVTLQEGSVEVQLKQGDSSERERLVPGEQLRLHSNANGNWEKSRVDLNRAMSWTNGRLIFREESLQSAIVEINRYAAVKVRLGDPSLADLTVSGNFIAGESSIVVKAIVEALPLRVVDLGNELVLFPIYDVQKLRDSHED